MSQHGHAGAERQVDKPGCNCGNTSEAAIKTSHGITEDWEMHRTVRSAALPYKGRIDSAKIVLSGLCC